MKTPHWSFVCLFAVLAALTLSAAAQTPDGQTPAVEDVCDGEAGAAYGLCVAYCEAMDCDSDSPDASETACGTVAGKFTNLTGRSLPCELYCPCFTADDLWNLGTVFECGVNFPYASDLAGWVSDGGVACSGFLCADSVGRTCAISSPFNSQTVTAEEDESCRALILQECPNPNFSSPVTEERSPSPRPFIDQ